MSFKLIVRAALLAIVAVAVSACQAPIGTDQVYTRADAKALVVFGLKYDVPMTEFQFANYDVEKDRMANYLTGWKKYDGMMLGYSKDLRFFADIWEPGFYKVTHYCYAGGQQTCVSLSPTLYFEVKPGQVNYLGNFYLGYEHPGHTGYTDDLVKAYMADFKHVEADIVRIEMLPTPARPK
jgi:hypothetical protein